MDKAVEALGLNLPQLIAQVVNFFVLLFVLRLVAYKPILKMLDERKQKIAEGLNAAEIARAEAPHHIPFGFHGLWIDEAALFYLKSRGLSEEQAMGMVVNGFIEPVTRTLPVEYAVEWSRLIELQMEGSVG